MDIFDGPKPTDFEFNQWDAQYKALLHRILHTGWRTDDRTGTGTLQVPSATIVHDLSEGFPMLTTKKLHFKSIKGELLWFISGDTNKFTLKEKYGVSIWDEWGDDETGELGPVYGHQWRNWKGGGKHQHIDQLQNAIDTIKRDPFNRRIRVSAWNVGEISQMALPACHTDFQFVVQPDDEGQPWKLHCTFNMRSVDTFLGLPFNFASYALLLQVVAQVTELEVGTLTWNGTCVHLYQNHLELVREQLARPSYKLPTLLIHSREDLREIDDFTMTDLTLDDYQAHPNWKNVPVAV